jgi:hypothetical protein
MAFDLRGIDPQNYDGEWIRFNVWNWHRIWRASKRLFPKKVNSVIFWYSNLGECVPFDVAKSLADSIEGFGIERFAREACSEAVVDPQDRIGNQTIVTSLEYELPAFILFLKSSGGFTIE